MKSPKKIRSPSFPFISLMEAVARARGLYDAERWHSVRPEVAVSHWGYSPTSSGGRQTLAALRAYGLLQDDEGMVRLSDRALRLLRDPGDTPERAELLRQAALAPPLHSRLWERYGADLPSNKSLWSWLVLELRFNEGSVEDFLRSYKETMAFAGLVQDRREAELAAGPAPERMNELSLSFPLANGNQLELRIRRKIRPEEEAKVNQLFQMWLEQIVDRP
jgi:hypothetical protein